MDTLAVHTFDECLHVDMDNTPGSPYPPGNVSPIAAGTFESMIFLSYKYGEICDRSLEGTLHPKKIMEVENVPRRQTIHIPRLHYRSKSIPEYLMAFVGFHILNIPAPSKGSLKKP